MKYNLNLVDRQQEVLSPNLHSLKTIIGISRMLLLDLNGIQRAGPLELFGFVENREAPILVVGTDESQILEKYIESIDKFGSYKVTEDIDEDLVVSFVEHSS